MHLLWDDVDRRQLDAQRYDALLFVGDLAGYRPGGGVRVARSMSQLRTPGLAIPGNHDAVHAGQLVSEILSRPALRRRLGSRQPKRVRALDGAFGAITLGGYSVHQMRRFQVLVARPHAMGGPGLAFERYLASAFSVTSMQDSIDRLRACVDRLQPGVPLIILAHNGPLGLGDRRGDICGRDFHRDEGDWGDPDLAEAVRYATQQGHDLRAVVFGHMHLGLRGGGRRAALATHEGVLYVNAAEVPRHRRDKQTRQVLARHHVRLEVPVHPGAGADASHIWL